MAKKLLRLSFTLAMTFGFITTFSQAPANDNCADAIAVSLDEQVSFSTEEATTDGPAHAANCTSSGATPDSTYKDIWYTFTSSITGQVRWNLCGLTIFDTKIFVYGPDAPCQPTDDDILACNEDGGGACGVVSEVIFDVMEGETYLLRLGGYGDGPPGESGEGGFTLTEFIPAVPNDNCANAIAIGEVENYQFSTSDATTDGPDHPGNSTCFGFGSITADRDIWFTYTADFTGSMEWTTCSTINFDSRLAVYGPNVSCPVSAADLYACNDDGAGCIGFSSLLIFEVEEGNTYLLRLGGYSGESGIGTFSLQAIIPPTPPANDLCADAEEIYIIDTQTADDLDVVFEGTTIHATESSAPFQYPNCLGNQAGGEFATVWYRFNSLGNTEIEVRVNASTPEAQFYIDLFEACEVMVDEAEVESMCFSVTIEQPFIVDTIRTLPAEPTDYYLRVTTRLTSDAPGDFWLQLVGDIFVDTDEPKLGAFSFYPNPIRDIAVAAFDLEESARVGAQVFDALGRQVLQQDHGQLAAGKHNLEFDLDRLPAGIYFFNLSVDGTRKTMKFVKT
jgi:hypothetical protein